MATVRLSIPIDSRTGEGMSRDDGTKHQLSRTRNLGIMAYGVYYRRAGNDWYAAPEVDGNCNQAADNLAAVQHLSPTAVRLQRIAFAAALLV